MTGLIIVGGISGIGLNRCIKFLNVYAQFIYRHVSVELLLTMKLEHPILSSVEVKLEMYEDYYNENIEYN